MNSSFFHPGEAVARSGSGRATLETAVRPGYLDDVICVYNPPDAAASRRSDQRRTGRSRAYEPGTAYTSVAFFLVGVRSVGFSTDWMARQEGWADGPPSAQLDFT